MINWNAIKQAGEAKRGLFRSGRGAYKLEPDAGDVANLAGLSDAEYLAARDAIIDRDVKQLQQYRLRDQTLKKDNAARGWSLLGGMARSLYQRHKIRNDGVDVDYEHLDPRHLKAYQKTEMYNAEHEDKDRLKYQEALDKLVRKFRAQQAKLEAKMNAKRAADPLPEAPGVTQLIPNAHPKLIDFYNNQKKPYKIVTGVMSPGMDYSKDRLDPNRRVWQPTATENLIGGKGATRAEVGHAGIKALQGALSSGYPMWSHDAYRGGSGDFPMSKEAMLRRLNMLYRQRDADSAAWCKAMGVPRK